MRKALVFGALALLSAGGSFDCGSRTGLDISDEGSVPRSDASVVGPSLDGETGDADGSSAPDAPTSVCTPSTCEALGYDCGVADDGCGARLSCGSCTPPEYCGGAEDYVCGGAALVSGGLFHTCAVLSGGTVKCWGQNSFGQLGNGTLKDSTTPVAVPGLSGVTAVAAGGDHTCALLAGGTVKCWGAGSVGELGNGVMADSPTPVPVSGVVGATALAAGPSHNCVLLSGGTVQCWGEGHQGELGNGIPEDFSAPVSVSNLTGAVAVTAGSDHTCALLSDGKVECWGWDDGGELGTSAPTCPPGFDTPCSASPIVVSGLARAVAVVAADAYTCALLASGAVECWGINYDGQLGNGTVSNMSPFIIPTPTPVSNLKNVTMLASGEGDHGCARIAGGTVACWGDDYEGQIGNGEAVTIAPNAVSMPAAVLDLKGVTALGGGSLHSCARLKGGAIACWGYNEYGQLGCGTTLSSATPVPVSL